MRPMILRILKTGLPTATILAIVGYYMADIAAIGMGTQSATAHPQDAEWAETVSRHIKYRMPIGMALWGFGLVVVFEVALYAWRGNSPPPPPPKAPDPTTEELLNKLLEQAEAARNNPPETKATESG